MLVEGNLYKEVSRPEVYQVLDGKKIHIPTPDALRLMGYTFADVTTVVDGALLNKKLFEFASGSAKTPGSLLFPPKGAYYPLRGIPGATRVITQGLETQVGELRGWLKAAGKLDGGCGDDGDVKYSLEVDSEWALRQGINLHDILKVGNMGLKGSGIPYPGTTARRIIATPIVEAELNSFTWPHKNPPVSANDQRPSDWDTPMDCPEGTRYFPFHPVTNVDLATVPDADHIHDQRGPYVRMVGALVTDSPHTLSTADVATWLSRYLAVTLAAAGTPEANLVTWSAAALDWHPGVDPFTDPRHHARWTEIHPPDLIELVNRDPTLPWVTLRALGLVARPTECERAIFEVVPDAPRPAPSSVVAWEEIEGPETRWPHGGRDAQNGSWVTSLGDRILVLVDAGVCGAGLHGSPGRFKAFYRVWWK